MEKVAGKFATALEALMKVENLNQVDLANMAKVDQSFISRVLSGKIVEGRPENRDAVASALGKTYAGMLALGELILKEQSGEELNPVEKHQKRMLLGTHRPGNKTFDLVFKNEVPGEDETEKAGILKVLSNEHRSIIDAFRDKVSAYEINKMLLEIERLDPEKFDEIRAYIDLIYNRLARKKVANGD